MSTPPAQGKDPSWSCFGRSNSYERSPVGVAHDLEPSVERKERLKERTEESRAAMEAEATGQLEGDIQSAPHHRNGFLSKHQKGLQNMRVLAEDEFRAQLEQEKQERKSSAAIPLEGNIISGSLWAEEDALLTRFKKERERHSQQNEQQERPSGSERPPKAEVWLPESTAPPAPPNRVLRIQRKYESPNVDRPPAAQVKHEGLRGLFTSKDSADETDALGPSTSTPPPPAWLSWSTQAKVPLGGTGRGTGLRPVEPLNGAPPGTDPSPQIWKPSISWQEDARSTTRISLSYSTSPSQKGLDPSLTPSPSRATSKPWSSMSAGPSSSRLPQSRTNPTATGGLRRHPHGHLTQQGSQPIRTGDAQESEQAASDEGLFSIAQIFGLDAKFVTQALTIKENTDISALRTQVLLVCSMRDLYRRMLSLEGSEAQRWLDLLQTVLDGGIDDPGTPASERGKVFKALLSLSKSTGLYPQCLQLSHQLQKCDEPVAAGAFGEVFHGSVGNREVAIKVFRVYETTNVVKFKKRAWAEAILWCQLYHANVLPCYGIHHLSNQPSRIGLVSPWMGSGNVVDYLRANPTAGRPLLLSDIASGMSYLHDNNIVHGDLKGANILVSESGRACLTDFGLARVSGPALLTSVVTGTAKNTGTIRWLAPELLSIEDDTEPKTTRTSDIYSYGCACYEVMTGNIPFFQTRNNYSVPTLVLAGSRPRKPDPTDPACQEYGLTEEIWSLIERCWKHDAIQRPTAVEIDKSDLFSSLADTRPAQQWGYASAAEFRRLVMPLSSPGP